ncbi:MAG: hypothetical protein ACO3PR_13650, partial [Limisphaerales bacterium]
MTDCYPKWAPGSFTRTALRIAMLFVLVASQRLFGFETETEQSSAYDLVWDDPLDSMPLGVEVSQR